MTTESAKYRFLVVEDETLIALEIKDAVEALGCEIVGPATRCNAHLGTYGALSRLTTPYWM